MDKYLLLCRIKYEDGVIEPVYKWFSGADKMENYIRNVGKICRAKVFIDYAAEVIEDRIIIKREFKRDIVLCERSKEILSYYNDNKSIHSGYNKRLFAKYGIDIDEEIIAGYPLGVILDFLTWGHSIEEIELFFNPPCKELKDMLINLFVEAINICEEEQDDILGLDDQLVKRTIPKYHAIYWESIQANPLKD